MAHAVEITHEDIQKIVKELPRSFGCAKNYEVVSLSDSPVGFWGDHFILKVYNDKSEKHDFFLKALPRGIEKRMEAIQETGFFEREIKIYEHLVPKLHKISSICWAPKIYLSKEEHFIVMENLRDHKVYPSKNNVWDLKHFEVAAKTLAVFHASSVVYEEMFGKLIQDTPDLLDEIAYPKNVEHIRYTGVENIIKSLMKLIELIPKYRFSTKLNDILNAFPDVVRKIFMFVETSSKYRNVLLHGDIWVNNVMFLYNKNKEPVECKYIDFQFARHAPPAMDLATFFFASSTAEFREAHLNQVLNIYCDYFENELSSHNISKSALTRNEILTSFQEYRLAGLIESALFNHVTMLPADIATDMMSSSEEYEKFFSQSREQKCLKAFEDECYRSRLTEILSEIIDDFILPELIF